MNELAKSAAAAGRGQSGEGLICFSYSAATATSSLGAPGRPDVYACFSYAQPEARGEGMPCFSYSAAAEGIGLVCFSYSAAAARPLGRPGRPDVHACFSYSAAAGRGQGGEGLACFSF